MFAIAICLVNGLDGVVLSLHGARGGYIKGSACLDLFLVSLYTFRIIPIVDL